MPDRELTPEEVDAAFAELVGDLELEEPASDSAFALTPRGTVAVRISDQIRMLVAGMAGAVAMNLSEGFGTVSVEAEDPIAALEKEHSLRQARAEKLAADARTVIETVDHDELDLDSAEAWLRVVNAWRIQILSSEAAAEFVRLHEGAKEILDIAAAIVQILSVELP